MHAQFLKITCVHVMYFAGKKIILQNHMLAIVPQYLLQFNLVEQVGA